MQDILDRKSPISNILSDSEDSEDEVFGSECVNTNHHKATAEFADLERTFKRKKYRPELDSSKSTILSGKDKEGTTWEIFLGPVLERGEDLSSGKNLADYIDSSGMLDPLQLLLDHEKRFPTLSIKAQAEAALGNVEVGSERFFNISGYISSPKRTRLGV